jgi:uncharacterized OB-fold protein
MSIARNWRLQTQRYRLVGEVCNKCGASIFPARGVCPECQLRGFDELAPYTMALPRLEESSLFSAQFADVGTDRVSVGMPVEMVTRKVHGGNGRGVTVYGYKSRPAVASVL